MADSTARKVAETIIHLVRSRGGEITNLKLQKLLYYAQAWHLVINDRKLFDEDIEAWVHGPVVARVFGDYKSYRWSPINCEVEPAASPEIISHIDEILGAYGAFSATELERLSHSERPWREARAGLPPDEPSRNVISTTSMKEYYSSLSPE